MNLTTCILYFKISNKIHELAETIHYSPITGRIFSCHDSHQYWAPLCMDKNSCNLFGKKQCYHMTSYIHCKKDSAIKCGLNSVQNSMYIASILQHQLKERWSCIRYHQSQLIKIFYTHVSSFTTADFTRRDHWEVPTINLIFV